MNRFMVVSSRDPFAWGDTERIYRLALDLKMRGNDVTLFLVQNGVFAAVRGAGCVALGEAIAGGVKVLAEDFSLRARALPAANLAHGVSVSPLDSVVDGLAEGVKTIWH
jgi:predicted peroxiredoxin